MTSVGDPSDEPSTDPAAPSLLEALAKREPRRQVFFAVRFPTPHAMHYVLFTEKLVDACAMISWSNGSSQLCGPLGVPVPDGAELLPPNPSQTPIGTRARWTPILLRQLLRPALEHGRVLADTLLGTHLDGGPDVGDAFVLAIALEPGADIFLRRPGSPLRHVLSGYNALAA